MKKLFASAVIVALFSSFIVPGVKPAADCCTFFRDTKFTYSCSDVKCEQVAASAPDFKMTGDAESMEFIKSVAGKELMDQVFCQMFAEILQGKFEVITECK